jgi:preprotein translocase subunit SecA
MFSTMMDGIKEESVGFLFNLEVQVEEEDGPAGDPLAAAPAGDADRLPLLDSSAPAAGATPVGERHPQIRAKGLGPATGPRELTYAAPSADGDAEVEVHRERVDDTEEAGGPSPRRNAARAPGSPPRQRSKKSRNKKKRR